MVRAGTLFLLAERLQDRPAAPTVGEEMPGGPNHEGVQSVVNALRVLEAFDERHPHLGVTELAERLGLHKSVVHRLLKTLEARHWVRQHSDRRYGLTLRPFAIGSRVVGQMGLGTTIQPLLERLALETRETANVGVLDGDEIVYVNKVVPEKVLRVDVQLGVRLPAHCTAMGKLLLAFASEEQQEAFLAGRARLPRRTRRTIEDPAVLRQVWREARRQGFVWSDEELFEGICCVAAPIRDFSGRVIAALSLAMQAASARPERRDYLTRRTRETAALISRHLGCDAGAIRDG